jgi:translation initiation factor 2 subunit 2
MSMNKDYDELLDNIYENLPEKATSEERFEMPKFEYFTEGNKTIIKNFRAVAEKVRRDSDFIVKYMTKELAAPAEAQGERLVIQRKLSGDMVNKKLEEFVHKYVICKECKRPDTAVKDSGHGSKALVCESCGARRNLR